MSVVRIIRGSYRGVEILNTTYDMVKPPVKGARGYFVTVDPAGDFDKDTIRVRFDSMDDIEITGSSDNVDVAGEVSTETDDEIIARIEERFDILDQMTQAAIAGNIRAMIVSGPPGVGKSYGVEYQLERAGIFDAISTNQIKYEIIKGSMTAVNLYCTLYSHSDKNSVVVFDDCDSVLFDDAALNVLKAALDSGKRRRIYWAADSSVLRRDGVPDSFEFKGSVIFISNMKFNNVKSKKLQDHLEALQSRCHYLDLALDSMRERILRIKQIHRKGDLFEAHEFAGNEGDQIIEFMIENKDRLREVSLRMAQKLADLVKMSPLNWKRLAVTTCCMQ